MSKKSLLVWSDIGSKEDFLSRSFPPDYEIVFMDGDIPAIESDSPEAYFILDESLVNEFNYDQLNPGKPIFVNQVCGTIENISKRKDIIRINAWPGFLRFPLLELAAGEGLRNDAENLLAHLNWQYRWVADTPGMVTPRVIAMIVNEACFALSENVSTPAEIDIALKLGTSYPRGPFEWAKQIGPNRIIELLTILSEKDERYTPAPSIHNNLQLFS